MNVNALAALLGRNCDIIHHRLQMEDSPLSEIRSDSNRARWSTAMDKHLVNTSLELNTTYFRSQNSWKPKGWKKLLESMNREFPSMKLTMQQLKQHECDMKKDYKDVKHLIEKCGLGWNPSLCMLETTEDVWNSIIEGAGKKYKKWKRKPFLHCDAMRKLYEGHTVEENQNIPSNHDPLLNVRDGLNEEEEEEEEGPLSPNDIPALRDSPRQHMPLEEPILVSGGSSQQNLPLEDPISVFRDSCRQHIPLEDPIPAFGDSSNHTSNSPRKRPKSAHYRIADAMEAQMLKEEARDAFSVRRCMELIARLNMSEDEIVKAAKLWTNPTYREIFIYFPNDNCRVRWIRSMI